MKKYMKRTLCTLTVVACLSGGASVFAANSPEIVPINAPLYEIMQQNKLDSFRIYGNATSIEKGRIVLENNNENTEFPKVVLQISEQTLILDAVTGLPKSIDDIRENETVYAYVGPAMTMSLPPITSAEVLLTGIPADFAVPTFEEIDSVEQGENGTVKVKTNRDVTHTITDETELTPYLTKNIITKHHLVPGTKMLVWKSSTLTEVSAESTKMMVFPYSYEGYVKPSLDGVSINGEALKLADNEKPYLANGRLMLPFRQFVEALGYNIKWDGETNGIKVMDGDKELYSFTARGTELVQGEDKHTLFEAAAVKNGVTFMSADDLIHFNGAKLAE
ncbi:copper amine oxidase N-terminal domain-containing protein [Paenibacillus sp. GSMTC-2017]|uniref:copper amine oxidase N-terminal domain-containing protein n=1 Tax=Paenibacillus sp. GSMTC-2017 TaxID=2794350 RepID=UPI0018D72C04|nr:copper amine oxidase N-terminal domain-containing protein [Paenibacillus sp. GSMTC-2017]MBH5318430.1 copper amine oxidase N-terminal domain-containing protein [Paenibacillus sp. GSMTC-2017]